VLCALRLLRMNQLRGWRFQRCGPLGGPGAAHRCLRPWAAAARRVACRSSTREQKDPARFASMEEARKYLHSEAEGSGPISGLLNWLSNSAFGMTQVGERSAQAGVASQRRPSAATHHAPSAFRHCKAPLANGHGCCHAVDLIMHRARRAGWAARTGPGCSSGGLQNSGGGTESTRQSESLSGEQGLREGRRAPARLSPGCRSMLDHRRAQVAVRCLTTAAPNPCWRPPPRRPPAAPPPQRRAARGRRSGGLQGARGDGEPYLAPVDVGQAGI
jgi:hypothetical protein